MFEIVVTNSIPTKQHKLSSLKTITIAPLIADIILNVTQERSVTSLYQ